MDPRMLQAGVAMGLGLLLFIPTFNALNNSYVENVAPPPWMPLPDEIPENFEPPDDFTLPDDYTPPEGDYEIPPEWAEKYKGKMPPGGCPPPVVRPIAEIQDKGWNLPEQDGVLGSNGETSRREYVFNLHETTIGFQIWVNLTGWRGGDASVTLVGPNGTTVWDETKAGPGGRNVINQPGAQTAEFEHFDVADMAGTDRITPGQYTLTVSVASPDGGAVKLQGQKGLACGGMLAS